jgi:predicted site-specific integrase-resolvase
MIKKSQLTKQVYKPKDVKDILNISTATLIKYDKTGILKFNRLESDRRVMYKDDLIAYLLTKGLLIEDEVENRRDVIYCRVSSHEQKVKGDLDRQVVKIIEYASNLNLNNPLILKEVGSGLNDNRKQLQKLLKMVMNKEVSRIFISYKDRLTRFGYHYLETICTLNDVNIIIVSNDDVDKDIQEELVEDMISLIASFSGRLYGMRSKEKRKAIAEIEGIETINESE